MEPITKVCNKCGEEKDIKLFHKATDCKHGVKGTCKKCCCLSALLKYHDPLFHDIRIQQSKNWKKNNSDRNKEKQAEYKNKNKENLCIQNELWRKNNPSKHKNHRKKIKENQCKSLSEVYIKEKLSQKGIEASEKNIKIQKELILIKRLTKKLKSKKDGTENSSTNEQ